MKRKLLCFVLLLTSIAMAQTLNPYGRTDGTAILNDLALTPGAIRPGCSVAEICAGGFSTAPIRASIKNFPKLKQEACALYGVAAKDCDGTGEGDHCISLELCGCKDCLTNIWFQPYHPVSKASWEGGAKDKDLVENYLHRWVCDPAIPTDEQVERLTQAEHDIATDWAKWLPIAKAAVKKKAAK